MLRADADFEHFGFQIDAVRAVELDCGRVDRAQALDGRFLRRAAAFEIFARFGLERVQRKAGGIAPVIHVHAAALVGFRLDEKIDAGGAARFARVERPFVALEKDAVQRVLAGERVEEKLTLHAVLVHRYVARNRLLIAA